MLNKVVLTKSFVNSYQRQTLNLPDGNNFYFPYSYIYAAAGHSFWNQCLSLFTACGFFMPFSHSKKNNEL